MSEGGLSSPAWLRSCAEGCAIQDRSVATSGDSGKKHSSLSSSSLHTAGVVFRTDRLCFCMIMNAYKLDRSTTRRLLHEGYTVAHRCLLSALVENVSRCSRKLPVIETIDNISVVTRMKCGLLWRWKTVIGRRHTWVSWQVVLFVWVALASPVVVWLGLAGQQMIARAGAALACAPCAAVVRAGCYPRSESARCRGRFVQETERTTSR